MNELLNQAGTDLGTYGGVGGLLPILLAVINRPTMPSWAKGIIMVIVSIIAGAVTYGVQNGWDFSDIPHVLAAVVGVATATQIAYHGLWKKSGMAPAIEQGVNGGPSVVEGEEEPAEPVEGDQAPDDDDEDDIAEDDPTADEEDVPVDFGADDTDIEDSGFEPIEEDPVPEHAAAGPSTPVRTDE